MASGEIMLSTAVATTIVVMGYWYFVARKQQQREPKQAKLGDFDDETTSGNTSDMPRL